MAAPMDSDDQYASLPIGEFAFPGELRERLVAAILEGRKTTTSCLMLEFELDGEDPPVAGHREVVVDSQNRAVAVIELVEARTIRLGDVDLRHAVDEGEGFESVAEWRRGHEHFWHSAEFREAVADRDFTVNDATLMFAQRFRLIADLRVNGRPEPRPRPPVPAPRS